MKRNKLKERIVKNSFWNLSYLILGKIGALIFTIILARYLTPDGYGLFSIVLSVCMIFFTFGDLGLNYALNKYLSESLKKDKSKVAAYYSYILKVRVHLALWTSIIFILLAYPIAHYVFHNDILTIPLIVSSIYIFAYAFDAFYSQIFYAIEKVEYLSLREAIYQVMRILFVLIIFNFVSVKYHLSSIYFSFAIVSLVMIFYGLYYSKKFLPEMFDKPKDNIDKKRILKFMGYLTLASISGVFFSYIDSVMLGIYASPEYVGYYRAAFTLVFGVAGLLSFPNMILLSVFSKLNKNKVNLIFEKAVYYTSLLTLPAIAGLIVLGNYFIKLLYGSSYLPAAIPLYYLSIMILPAVLVGIFLSLFSAENNPQIFAKLVVISSAINIILNYILIKSLIIISQEWAMAGAAIATSISWIFYLLALCYAVRKRIDIRKVGISLIKPLIGSIVMFIAILIFLSKVRDVNILNGVFVVILGFVVYFVVMLLIRGITYSDLKLFKGIIRRQ